MENGNPHNEAEESVFPAEQQTASPAEIQDTSPPDAPGPEAYLEGDNLGADDFEDEDTITFKRSHLYMVLVPLAFAVGLSVGYLLWGRATAPEVPAAVTSGQAAPAAAAPSTNGQAASSGAGGAQAEAPSAPSDAQVNTENVVRYDVTVDDDYILGPENAPITLIEFSDYECPYCRKWHAEVYKQLLAAFPGQIRFVYRDFPLTSIHSNAVSAAEAANCAGEQGQYYEFHDRLFSMQYGLGDSAYALYAQELALDTAVFAECMESDRHLAEVQADFEFAARLGVQSTPTFFINGIPIVGAQPFEVFQQVISLELAGEIP